jgi:hypothetical protein
VLNVWSPFTTFSETPWGTPVLLAPGLPPVGAGAGAGVVGADVVDGAVLACDVDGGGGALLTRGVVVVGRGVGVTDRVAVGELVR